MKRFSWAVSLLLLFAGCSDVVETVSEPLPFGPGPQVRAFPADPRATYAAARKALDQLGFRFVRGGPAQGEMEAISAVSPGDNPGSSHQYTLKAAFRGKLDGSGTEVSVEMTEIVEDDTERHQGMGTETPLQDTALQEAFFHAIEASLPTAAR